MCEPVARCCQAGPNLRGLLLGRQAIVRVVQIGDRLVDGSVEVGIEFLRQSVAHQVVLEPFGLVKLVDRFAGQAAEEIVGPVDLLGF